MDKAEAGFVPTLRRGLASASVSVLSTIVLVFDESTPIAVSLGLLGLAIICSLIGLSSLLKASISIKVKRSNEKKTQDARQQYQQGVPAGREYGTTTKSRRPRTAVSLIYVAAMLPFAALVWAIAAGITSGRLYDNPIQLATADSFGMSRETVIGGSASPTTSFAIADNNKVNVGWFLPVYRAWYLHAGVQVGTSQGTGNCLSESTILTITIVGDSHVVYGPARIPLSGAIERGAAGWYVKALTLSYLSLGRVTQVGINASISGAADCHMSLALTDAAVHSEWPLAWHI